MDYGDLKQKNKGELKELLLEQQGKLRQLRFEASERQLKNVREIRKVRATVARILTILNTNKETT